MATIYYYDEQGEYTKTGETYKVGKVELPNESVTKLAPPSEKKGVARVFNGEKWEYIADNRGLTAYSIENKNAVTIDYLGEVKDGYTLLKPENKYQTFEDGGWVINAENKGKQLSDAQLAGQASIKGIITPIYHSFQEMLLEYQDRYKEAIEYKEAGYSGEMGLLLISYAFNAQLTKRQATDDVITKNERAAFMYKIVGSLRMEHNRLKYCTTVEECQGLVASVKESVEKALASPKGAMEVYEELQKEFAEYQQKGADE